MSKVIFRIFILYALEGVTIYTAIYNILHKILGKLTQLKQNEPHFIKRNQK